MKTRRIAAFALLLMLAILPFQSLATQVEVPEYGLSLAFPASLDVFSRNMAPENPVLFLYGKTAGEVADELRNSGLYAEAYDIAGEYQLTLTLNNSGGVDYGTLDEAGLAQIAKHQGMEQYELVEGRQGTFLLVGGEGGQSLVLLYQAQGLAFELRLIAGISVTRGMHTLLKGMAQRVDFTLGQ